MQGCKICGFPLKGRPGLKDKDGVCLACVNAEAKKNIDFEKRQKWLTEFIKECKNPNSEYDCIVAVSGGKDSHMIVKRLIENHGAKNPLLVTLLDEFTQTKAGKHNLKNIAEYFDLDHLLFRYKPKSSKKEMLKLFRDELNPLKDFDDKMVGIDGLAMKIARNFGINLVFYGENASFEYGNQSELEIFHPFSDDRIKYVYLGAIYPYSIKDSLEEARSVGFRDLNDFKEWDRQGNFENSTQIDSVGYVAHQWCKFVKYGAQRCTDIATRLVRENKLTREQALLYINKNDHILDPRAKRDLCNTMGITEKEFDKIVEKHVNSDIIKKDANGVFGRKKDIC